MRDVLDDLADDMSQAVPENKWTDLLIYLIEALERKQETEKSLIRCYMGCSNISLNALSESAELNY